jgi:hypothetical protein
MIEWVKIKDWNFEKFQLCIVHYKIGKDAGFFSLIHKESDFEDFEKGYKITHIAAINPIVEKTLEEKFEGYFKFANGHLTINHHAKEILNQLAQIAKEHYEGKE